MQVNISQIANNQVFKMRVEPSDTIKLMKEIIEDRKGVPMEKQRVLFSGTQLQNGWTLSECRVKKDSLLHLDRRP